MSSLTDQSSKNTLAFKLVMQLTDLADGATFTKRMAVLQDIKEAWERNTEVTVITEDESYADSEQASLNRAEGEPGPQLWPYSNLGNVVEERENDLVISVHSSVLSDPQDPHSSYLGGPLDTKSLFKDVGLDALQDFSPHRRLVEEDASADGLDSTGNIPHLQGGGKTRSFECKTCRRSFNLGEFSWNRPFHCPHCQQSPAEQGGLNGASRTINPPTNSSSKSKASATSQKPFPCQFCPCRFKRKAHLMAHIETHNGDKQFPSAFSTTAERNPHTKSHLMPNFTCDKKQTKSPNHSSQQGNAAHASTLKAPKRRQMAASTGIQKKYEHFRVNKKVTEGYKCSICSRIYFTLKGIQKHTENHSKIQPEPEREKKVIKKPFQCESCLKQFASSTSLKRHIVEVCSKQLASKKQPAFNPHSIRKVNKKMPTLTEHSQETLWTPIMKNVPKGKPANRLTVGLPQKEKLFKCKYCEKESKCRSQLEDHERIHTGEKPFECQICNKWFRIKSVRNKHWKDMHPEMIPELKETNNIRIRGQKEKIPSLHPGLKAQALKAGKMTPIAPGMAKILNQGIQDSDTSSMQASKKALFPKESLNPGASTSQSKFFAAANHYIYSPAVTSVRSLSKQASQHKSPSTSYLSSPTSHRGQQAEVHKNLIPHQCQMCSKVFASAAKLAFHEKSHVKHSSKSQDTPSVPETSEDQEQLCNCVFCDEVFSRLDEFMEHQRQLHTGNKPFSCKCGAAYTIKKNLIKHKRQFCVLREETGPTPK